ncbi:hypothetical protein AGMMS50230_16260 [Spirochaetia bacterium]|nr:hypothetical protein AGMMS50230_16260 [Spirochaetia bacterium]
MNRPITQLELTAYNLGKSLDNLMNLDPRGYGVCTILYDEALRLAGLPLTMHAASSLLDVLGTGQKNPVVFIITGFVLHPFNKQETDGPLGAAALARTLVKITGARPVFIVPAEAKSAMEKLSALMGFASQTIVFTKDPKEAQKEAERIIGETKKESASVSKSDFPVYCIAIEAAGANKLGVYHNALGLDISSLEAKSDVLFTRLQEAGVPTLAVGDLGNECGMGTLGKHALKYIPGAAKCSCPCGGGLLAASSADTVLTTTVSNWGAWGISSAMAYLARKPEALYDPELEEAALHAANQCGLIDMYGEAIPAVDGMNLTKNKSIITLMNECVLSALELEDRCKHWFEKTIELGFFDRLAAHGDTHT